MPSRISPSLNFRRTQRPSLRGRLVNVLRLKLSESANSRTKYTPFMSVRSIATTFPAVFKTSNLPWWTKLAGATYPLSVSRSILRTMTFLWVEDISYEAQIFVRPLGLAGFHSPTHALWCGTEVLRRCPAQVKPEPQLT